MVAGRNFRFLRKYLCHKLALLPKLARKVSGGAVLVFWFQTASLSEMDQHPHTLTTENFRNWYYFWGQVNQSMCWGLSGPMEVEIAKLAKGRRMLK